MSVKYRLVLRKDMTKGAAADAKLFYAASSSNGMCDLASLCEIIADRSAACSNVQIEGSWIEPVPGMPEMVQGITLENGGKATSINMATLQYESWEKNGDKLVLSGKSIGNHQTISFSDTLQIEELTTENLVLKKGDLVIKYQRQN